MTQNWCEVHGVGFERDKSCRLCMDAVDKLAREESQTEIRGLKKQVEELTEAENQHARKVKRLKDVIEFLGTRGDT